ncbi:MAG: hypothetical protein DRP56_10190 [Planctomycetota bacterium]|nr:MAG: hypothetical protein DRP56_10190 [Planctomycetota bacterium]
MKKAFVFSVVAVVLFTGLVFADTFGTGANQFEIDFVPISGSTNPTSGYGIVNNDYRMGKLEISNAQWTKFKNAYGTVTGNPSNAYDESPYWTGTNVPTNEISWYEAAQFVNYLNTSTGHQAAYKFTGTQGTSGYMLDVWDVTNAAGGTNLYRHKDTFYFLPTEDEWVKAAYWNGSNLQTWATVGDVRPTQDSWNFWDDPADGGSGFATDPRGPWDVGSGSEELNGTFDMMGNVWEWMENPYYIGDYLSGSGRGIRGGTYDASVTSSAYGLSSPVRYDNHPYNAYIEGSSIGFRVASVPEPATLVLLAFGGILIRKMK